MAGSREQFEKWMRSVSSWSLTRGRDDQYLETGPFVAWECWQARESELSALRTLADAVVKAQKVGIGAVLEAVAALEKALEVKNGE